MYNCVKLWYAREARCKMSNVNNKCVKCWLWYLKWFKIDVNWSYTLCVTSTWPFIIDIICHLKHLRGPGSFPVINFVNKIGLLTLSPTLPFFFLFLFPFYMPPSISKSPSPLYPRLSVEVPWQTCSIIFNSTYNFEVHAHSYKVAIDWR